MPPVNIEPAAGARMTTILLLAAAPLVADIAAADVTFTAAGISLTISSDGKGTTLVDTVAGQNRNRADHPLCAIAVADTRYGPTGFSVSGNRLTYTFENTDPAVSVTIHVEERQRYLVFTLESVSPQTGFDEIRFVDLLTRDAREYGASCLMFFDDDSDGSNDRILGMCTLNLFTRTRGGVSHTGGFLRAVAHPNLPHPTPVPLTGRQVALFTAPADETCLFDLVGQIESDYAIPIGVAAKQLPALRRSCFFWMDFAYEQRDLALQYTQDAGAGRILLMHSLWGDYRRRYDATTSIWGSSAALKNWVAQCQAAGVTVGAHLYPGLIFKSSIDYIHAGCHPLIHRDRATTLAADLPASQADGLIETTAPPTNWPTNTGHRDLVIGAEIIEYTGIQTSQPPYGFTGPFVRAKNQTGEGGLGPQDHAAGAAIEHLVSAPEGARYQWGIASGGVAQWCADLAARLDQAGFQFIFMDGAESTQDPLWYTLGYLPYTLYNATQNPPLWFETSTNPYCFCWPLVLIDNQTNYFLPANQFKREVDRNVERMLTVSGFTRRHLGWAPLAHSRFQATPDDLEYLLSKSLAHGVPVVVQAWMYGLESWPNRDANLYLMSQYEQLRLSHYFPQHVRTAARRPRKDFMLFTDHAGDYHFVPTSLLDIASWSADVRGFITDQSVDGSRYVTLWPTALDGGLLLLLDGVTVQDVAATDYRGNPLALTDVGGGPVAVPVTTRVYLELVNLPDPVCTFSRATVRPTP